ncbi:hypothetical protein BpHYR1_045340 [Brachionus plicatilis]|uniref:Uncharacterized protein n=1 Tax=Brachionus plicatilis TaxID=10195 RepID=A0A3M7SRT1_BRAPC|nr:hypothetical protein BpHYR1_045340 [Brachionus plicatilis]
MFDNKSKFAAIIGDAVMSKNKMLINELLNSIVLTKQLYLLGIMQLNQFFDCLMKFTKKFCQVFIREAIRVTLKIALFRLLVCQLEQIMISRRRNALDAERAKSSHLP